MGYSNYLGFISKREYNKIKSLSEQEYVTQYNLDYAGRPRQITQLYDFGKYCEFDLKGVKPFFKNKELQKNVTVDEELYVVNLDFFESIIRHYEDKIKKYYIDMITPIYHNDNGFYKTKKTEYGMKNDTHTFDFSNITKEEQTALWKMMNHIRGLSIEWTHLKPFNLTKGDRVTDSWKYEYSIFELVRLYKTFDSKKNVLVYYGG